MRLLADAFKAGSTPRCAARPRTRRDHAELAEAAKELLAARMAERLSLAALAAALHVSPFHLARVFRARTGFSLSGYVHGLRLRAAVERLAAEPDTDLSRLAVELGYYSPSHFCDRFRATFGRPPSAVRGAQLRTIVEAVGAGAA
jgi:AraC-like DNA-binding protein